MVLDETASSGNVYNEYLYINEDWELIGTTEVQTNHLYEHNISAVFTAGSLNIQIEFVFTSASATAITNIPNTLPSGVTYPISAYVTNSTTDLYTFLYIINTASKKIRIYYKKVDLTATPLQQSATAYYELTQSDVTDTVTQIF